MCRLPGFPQDENKPGEPDGEGCGPSAPIVNRLLAPLPRPEYQRLLANLDPVTLTFGEVFLYLCIDGPDRANRRAQPFSRRRSAHAHGLLITRNRIGSDHFRLTHDFLGHIPGVRRVGVTKVAHALNQRQLVDYDRGNIAIINRSGLEAASCSCYEMVKEGAR